jgi:YD repeat-containing protein
MPKGMKYRTFVPMGLALVPSLAMGCGLDWSLPHTHYDGVEENGYVAYWERLGEADLGDGLVIPVQIGFNSHREASSPTLGKGWIVPLLESHVEPVDENSLKVVMPDGWTFIFYRNGNTETWRGNSGWVGETNDTSRNRALTYRYNGGVATEVDADGKPFVEVEGSPATGMASDLVIGSERIDLSQAQRPRVATKLNQNLITGFDQSLNQLQWPDGRKETFAFGLDKDLNPTLAVTATGQPDRDFTWDANSRQIKTDGRWTYSLQASGDHLRFDRTSSDGQSESYEGDEARGVTTEKVAGGPEITTYRFPNGLLEGRIRKITQEEGRSQTTLYAASYFPTGQLMRETISPDRVRIYSESGKLLKETEGKETLYQQDYDEQGRLVHIVDPAKQIEVKRTFDPQGDETTQVFKEGSLFYTEQTDKNNKLISFNEGENR